MLDLTRLASLHRMSADDSTSEDEDYTPNNAEVQEAEVETKRKKRWRDDDGSEGRKLKVRVAGPEIESDIIMFT